MSFYSHLAPIYDGLFPDWQASVSRQGSMLAGIIRDRWGEEVTGVLDAAAGIGTQTFGLVAEGFEVSASDLCSDAIDRLATEADERGLDIPTRVADLRCLSEVHGEHDVVIACDNALPHLLSDDEIVLALEQCWRCTRPGGGCLITLRDYPEQPPTGTEYHPYRDQLIDGVRHLVFQVWQWDGPYYDLWLCLLADTGASEESTQVLRTRYYAIPPRRVLELMREAGFVAVERLDDVFYQPVLVGTRPGR